MFCMSACVAREVDEHLHSHVTLVTLQACSEHVYAVCAIDKVACLK